ncbi:OpcA/G6PD domain-containing protein [Nocardia farcinica]|uniref:OpcA/G6PD domain-containing protein n=1 Tax=Nocardia farcinica TaxID=37329 RepID=UPI0024572009|nr:OpcA/G6PD domain-containing protein [Nocardia farcinica]
MSGRRGLDHPPLPRVHTDPRRAPRGARRGTPKNPRRGAPTPPPTPGPPPPHPPPANRQPGTPLARRETRDCLAEELRRLDADEIYAEALAGIEKVIYE